MRFLLAAVLAVALHGGEWVPMEILR